MGSGKGGDMLLYTGTSPDGNGGSIVIRTGIGSVESGDILLHTGHQTATDSNTGTVVIASGTSVNGNAGSITLSAGSSQYIGASTIITVAWNRNNMNVPSLWTVNSHRG